MELLYDQNSKLNELRQNLAKDDAIAMSFYFSYCKEVCRFEPPVEYISQQYQKI